MNGPDIIATIHSYAVTPQFVCGIAVGAWLVVITQSVADRFWAARARAHAQQPAHPLSHFDAEYTEAM